MRLPWNKSKEVQLDLLEAEPGTTAPHRPVESAPRAVVPRPDPGEISRTVVKSGGHDGKPLLLAASMLYEDAHNPRTGFPEESIAELAEDIQLRGVLQPLVVHPADSEGRHQVHFGAKRLRAAIRAGLHEVPAVVRDLPADRYAQVAENQTLLREHGLASAAMSSNCCWPTARRTPPWPPTATWSWRRIGRGRCNIWLIVLKRWLQART